MDKKPTFSVAIPTHEMAGRAFLFRRCLESLWSQSLQDFEIVVTDNSQDDVIKDICEFYHTGIKYIRNPRIGMALNTNEAIKQSSGELIKILYMDDYLAHGNALKDILKHFKGQWLVTGCKHDYGDGVGVNFHYATMDGIVHNENSIGSPSVLTIKNDHPLMFNEDLTWLLDVEYYQRLYAEYGEPVTLEEINVIMGIHEGQATVLLSDELKQNELNYLTNQ